MDMGEHITQSELQSQEARQEMSLRPQTLDDYVGQRSVTDNLKIFIQAAKLRGEPLDHLLFYGPPGLGKTTLAGIIAREMGVDLRITSGPAIERSGDLAALITNLDENEVLFIDEIHRLNRSVEEVLYSAMEDYAVDILVGKGPAARSLRLELPKFTLIGATTRAGSLSAPLRDRFGVHCKFETYGTEDLMRIISRSAQLLGVGIDEPSLLEIALRSRGTPRVANRLLKRVRDFSQVMGKDSIDLTVTNMTLKALKVDGEGLEDLDRRILTTIIQLFHGGPVGIDTIAAAIGEERVTIEEAYEPYLIQKGFLYRTKQGRMVSTLAYKHLGLTPPQQEEGQIALLEEE